jgi:hypothetical protein
MVARALHLPPERLPDLAALCGNDITGGLVDPLWKTLNIPTISFKSTVGVTLTQHGQAR